MGIVGAGSVAFGTASLLARLGHAPVLWSPSGGGTRELLSTGTEKGDEDTKGGEARLASRRMTSTGELRHDFAVRVACTPAALARGCDGVLVLALPANGHRRVMEALAPEMMEKM